MYTKLQKSLALMVCLTLLVAFPIFSIASQAEETAEPITFTFSEHVANVKDQAPQVYAVIQAFEASHPNISIDLQGTSQDEHIQKMMMQAQSNTLPDLFWINRPNAVEMIKYGFLADIADEFMDDADFVSTFQPNVLESMQVDGRLYGVPCEMQINGIWYNKALFDQYGLDVPQTFDEYIACAKVFHENGVTMMAQGGKDKFVWAFYSMHNRYGFFEKIGDILAGTEKWNNPDFIKFYEKVAEMRDAGMFPENVSVIEYFNAKEMFLAGQSAMLDSGAWDTKAIESSFIASTANFTWGPTFDDSSYPQNISMKAPAHPYVVSAKVKAEDPAKYEAIIEFLKFYYGTEGTAIIADQNQSIPVTKYTGEVDSSKYPVFARMIEIMNDDWQSPMSANNLALPASIVSAYQESIVGVINGIYTPEEATDYLDGQMLVAGLL